MLYTYANGFVNGVYGYSETGALINKASDEDFVGNINRVTYRSYYFDAITGWYYCGRFYDVKANRFVDGVSMTPEEFMAEYYPEPVFATTSATTDHNYWYSYIINNADYGTCFTEHTSNWYSSLETLEIVVRLIYGEAPWWIADKQSVAWVLWYRRQAGTWGGTLYDVMLASGQFRAITGTEARETEAARIPSTGSASWDYCAKFAAALWAAASSGGAYTPSRILPKPTGFTTQKYFCSYKSFFLNSGHAYDNEAGLAEKGGVRIYEIFVPATTGLNYNTVWQAREAYDAAGGPVYVEGGNEAVNVYYDWSPST